MLFIEDAVQRLAGRLLTPEAAVLDREVVTGGEVAGEAIVARALTFPFASSRRLMIVRDTDRMAAEDLEALAGYLDDPAPTCCLALTAADMPDHPRLVAVLQRRRVVVSCTRLPEAGRPAWLKSQMRLLDPTLMLSDDAARLLAGLDENLLRLRNELVKVSAYLGGRGRARPEKVLMVDVRDVQAVVGRGAFVLVVDLPRAVADRAVDPALRHLHGLFEEGVPPLVILQRLRYHLRRAWTADGLRRALRILLEADLAIKRGRQPKAVLQGAVLRLVGAWPDYA